MQQTRQEPHGTPWLLTAWLAIAAALIIAGSERNDLRRHEAEQQRHDREHGYQVERQKILNDQAARALRVDQ